MDEINRKSAQKNLKPRDKRLLNNRFMLAMPSDWMDKTVYTFEGPIDDGIRHNIMVTVDNEVGEFDLMKFAEKNIIVMEEVLSGYHELMRGPVSLDNGVPAFELVYKWYPAEKRVIYQRVIFVLGKGTGYTLTATFSKKTWKTRGSELDKILKSFKLG